MKNLSKILLTFLIALVAAMAYDKAIKPLITPKA